MSNFLFGIVCGAMLVITTFLNTLNSGQYAIHCANSLSNGYTVKGSVMWTGYDGTRFYLQCENPSMGWLKFND
jgi:hypothetical protein